MRLTTVDGTFALHFHFGTTLSWKSSPEPGGGIRSFYVRATSCTVHPGECAKPTRPCLTPGAVTGIAKCSPLDQFNRWVGRKLALTRAIAHMPAEMRGRIWAAYLKRCPPPPARKMKRGGQPNAPMGRIQGGAAA